MPVPGAEKQKDQRPLLTPTEVAVILGLDKSAKNPVRTVLEMCRRGELVGVRVSRWTRITPESVDRLRYG